MRATLAPELENGGAEKGLTVGLVNLLGDI